MTQNKNYSTCKFYVETTIENMERTIEYANTLKDKTKYEKQDYALWSIDRQYNESYGALVFTKCFLHVISQDDYDVLNDQLYNAYKIIRRNIYKKLKE